MDFEYQGNISRLLDNNVLGHPLLRYGFHSMILSIVNHIILATLSLIPYMTPMMRPITISYINPAENKGIHG